MIEPFDGSLVQPHAKRLPGCSIFIHQNHAPGGEIGSIMVGMFVCLCLACQQPSKQEIFIPTRVGLGVKLLTTPTK